jgi:hypothetical protein
MGNKIYISGKITGLPFEEAKKTFDTAHIDLVQANFEVVNPMDLPHKHDQSWESFMREDLKAMLDCTHIFMLKNWHLSKGANVEYNLAKDLGLEIIFQ